jgi:hypothetical protein
MAPHFAGAPEIVGRIIAHAGVEPVSLAIFGVDFVVAIIANELILPRLAATLIVAGRAIPAIHTRLLLGDGIPRSDADQIVTATLHEAVMADQAALSVMVVAIARLTQRSRA